MCPLFLAPELRHRKIGGLMQNIIPMLGTALALCTSAFAQTSAVLTPNANLRADGIPGIAATLAARTAAYTEFKPAFAVSWHPKRNQLIVAQRATSTVQLHALSVPGGPLRQLT